MDAIEILNQAAQHKDYLLLAVSAVAVIVPVVLKVLGKQVPIVDQAIELVLKVVVALRKPKSGDIGDPPGGPSKPGDQEVDEETGLAKVVPIKTDEKP